MKLSARDSVLAVGLTGAAAIIAVGVPFAIAAPTAVPPSDSQGYVNSTARCTSPDTAVVFGTTDSSRIAVCMTSSGGYEYRGVRVRDGAKLIVTATQTSDETFVVKSDGAVYTVTPKALSVTVNGNTVRTESWTDYHGPRAPATSATKSATTSAAPSATTSAVPATSGPGTSAAPTASAAPTLSAVPSAPAAAKASPAPANPASVLPPPLPAEVGGSSSSTG